MSEELVVEPHAVTKLPDAKPLKLIGCFSQVQKKYSSGNLLLVGILIFMLYTHTLVIKTAA